MISPVSLLMRLDVDEQGRGEVHVFFLALLDVELRVAEEVLAKLHGHGAGEILDGRDVPEYLRKAVRP